MFTKEDIVYSYTTKQAIKDGVLVQVDKSVSEACGLIVPVLITRNLYDNEFSFKANSGKTIVSRIKDMLYFFCCSAKNCNEPTILFHTAIMKTAFQVKAQIKSFDFDDPSPAIFFMYPNED